MKKRILSFLMTIIMVLNMAPITVGAIEGASFTASSVTTQPGKTFTVAVNGNNLENLGSFDLEIYYDSSALTVNSTSNGSLVGDALLDVNTATAGVVKVSAISLSGLNGSGTFMNISFTAASDCKAGEYPVQVTVGEAHDVDLNHADVAGSTGTVTVEVPQTPATQFRLTASLSPSAASKDDTVVFTLRNLYQYKFASGDFTIERVAALLEDQTLTDQLKAIIETVSALADGKYSIAYNPSLVRGQGYYTGMVFEITCAAFSGAVAGGGRYDGMIGKFLGQQVPAVGFSIGFERICNILMDQGFKTPAAEKLALLYRDDAPFACVLQKAQRLRGTYAVTVLPQQKKLGKQLGNMDNAGFSAVAFFDDEEIKLLGQKAE